MRLAEIQDKLETARDFVECAFMACHELGKEQRDPLCTLVDLISDKLKAVSEAMEAQQARAEGSAT